MAAIPKARVLPDPVLALPQMSRPARAAGMVRTWMGNGSVMPCSAKASQRSGDTPMVPNPASCDIVISWCLFGPRTKILPGSPPNCARGLGGRSPDDEDCERHRCGYFWVVPGSQAILAGAPPDPVTGATPATRCGSLAYRHVGRLKI